MKVTIKNQVYEYENKTTLEEISNDFPGQYYCATVNNRLRELTYILDKDAEVEFLDISQYDSMKVYEASLRYLVAMAIKNIYPDYSIRYANSISMGTLCKIIDKNINEDILENIRNEVKRLISLNLKFKRTKYTVEEMKGYYESIGYLDKLGTLKYRKENVNLYECDGYRNYMYAYMVPSTGYIREFKLILYYPGFIMQYPRVEVKGNIPEFDDEPKFLKTLAQADKWSKNTHSENIYEINDKCDNEDELVKFIGVCETRHNRQLEEIGRKIEQNLDEIRLIAIAGPSSSGKTTFSKRLEIELMSRNISPMRISIDNYYLTNDLVPKDENGHLDFEDIRALNIPLFNRNMIDLMEGKEVQLPSFNFQTKVTSFSKPVRLEKNGVIIIEGIHALNDLLTKSVPKDHKFKIYIAPLPQRNIDNHNPISLTDIRLVRRIVRDRNFRGTNPEQTINMWNSVRRGEHKWIYPHMEGADYIFNSELGYEMLVLKKYGIDSLRSIPYDSPYFVQANRLLKFLKVYRSIPDDAVPNNSLIREFIGGSVFKE